MELMEIKNKGKNKVLPYTYLLKFNYNNSILYYYGVRYGNVSKNTLPINDIFKKYYSSSKNVQKLLNENITPFEIIIHKTFNSIKDATDFEIMFLTKINAKNRNDFLNRALNRKRYTCPTCDVSNLDGGNFNRHMKLYHNWNKNHCQSYKSTL